MTMTALTIMNSQNRPSVTGQPCETNPEVSEAIDLRSTKAISARELGVDADILG